MNSVFIAIPSKALSAKEKAEWKKWPLQWNGCGITSAVIDEYTVIGIEDYLQSVIHDLRNNSYTDVELPKSNVIAFRLENGARIVVRPSGTEPKVKVYYTTTGSSWETARALEESLKADFSGFWDCKRNILKKTRKRLAFSMKYDMINTR